MGSVRFAFVFYNFYVLHNGAGEEDRTPDLLDGNQTLYR